MCDRRQRRCGWSRVICPDLIIRRSDKLRRQLSRIVVAEKIAKLGKRSRRRLTTINLEDWEGPHTVSWVMNGTAGAAAVPAVPWFQPVVTETAAKS